ncbi:hypothetical protein LTR37_001682 [Vermiconidia calcicola]|uniref:Uncharacterized protein n=1 Tax=Vermiconidia calcicola TaxID=1690605 RepID=A0ACC3NUT6_9PEZI|nr:hypothetical protein LTR37_001682 [Vermiconidia calcicola]
MAEPSSKKQRTQPPYELLYHPGVPGRGEPIRLLLEAAGVPYNDIANQEKNGYDTVQKICMNKALESDNGNPPVFSPPALRVPGAGKDGKALVISQTPNILSYLGDRTGMAGDEQEKYWVAQLALTALDLANEVHDSHHPIAVAKYYEEQKEESKGKSKDIRENRFPKFFSYFQRTLQGNKERGGVEGKYMVGKQLTYADTTIWQVLDGCMFAFPKEMEARKEEFPDLLQGFYESVKSEKGLKEYLASDRRLEYSMGIFRQYPELDRQ